MKKGSALYAAANAGDVDLVLCCLKEGADPNHESARGGFVGMWPLHAAASAQSIKCVRALLQAGANPLNKCSDDGWVALHNAAFVRDYEICALLSDVAPRACLIQGKLKGLKPIDVAKNRNAKDIVELLTDAQRQFLERNPGATVETVNGEVNRSTTTKSKRSKRESRKSKKRLGFLTKRAKRLFQQATRRSSRSKEKEAAASISKLIDVPDRWPVALAAGDVEPVLPLELQRLGTKLATVIAADERNAMDVFNDLRRALAAPLTLVTDAKAHKETDDQVYRDLCRELIIVNGSTLDDHLAQNFETALSTLRRALSNAVMTHWTESWGNVTEIVDWILQSSCRTIHGGISHAVVMQLLDPVALETRGAFESTLKALQQSLFVDKKITAREYNDIVATTKRGATVDRDNNVSPSKTCERVLPITPSHSADEALTSIVVNSQGVLVLSSSAFDVDVPAKFVVQATVESSLTLPISTDPSDKGREGQRILRLALWRSGEEVERAIEANGGSASRSLAALIPSNLSNTRMGSNVEDELSRLRTDTLSVTPLLDAAREMQTRIGPSDVSELSVVSSEKMTTTEGPVTVKTLRCELDAARRMNARLLKEFERVSQERDAALALLLKAGQNQADLLKSQKESRRESDLQHARAVRSLRKSLLEKDHRIEALRSEIRRLRGESI